MFSWRRPALVASMVVVVGLLTPGLALGAPPTIERIEVSETAPDEFLTEECGVAVDTTAEGHIIIRSFEDRTGGVREVFTVNVALTATSEFGEFRLRDVGADVTKVLPDGTLVVSVIGQVPFEFTGIEKRDGGGNVIFTSGGDRGARQLVAACAALTP